MVNSGQDTPRTAPSSFVVSTVAASSSSSNRGSIESRSDRIVG